MAGSVIRGLILAVLLTVVLAGAGVVVKLLGLLLPELWRMLPLEVQLWPRHPLTWVFLSLPPILIGVERLARPSPIRGRIDAVARAAEAVGRHPIAAMIRSGAGRIAEPDRRIDPAAGWVLGWPITVVLAVGVGAMLLAWAPHYLTWPYWIDTEQFAITALEWHAGILPYRDLADFDFPGPIYLLYALGGVFGWGRTAPYYAVDLALLATVIVAVLAWGRRLSGRWTPGLIGILPWLVFYLSQDFTHVAQRDWQAGALSVLGLLALETLPGRFGRPVSAFALAAALVFRPQPVVFGPAYFAAILQSARRPGDPAVHPVRALLEWALALAASLLIVFAPLIAAGVLDDFIGTLRIAHYGGSYNRVDWYAVYLRTKHDFWVERPLGYLWVALGILAAAGPAGLRGSARTWLLALIGAMFYRPISPVAHDYLIEPLRLVESIAMVPLVACLISADRLSSSIRLAGLAIVLATIPREWPRFCTFRGSLEAIGPLVCGEVPTSAPPGCAGFYPRAHGEDYWDDYRRTLLYLRHQVARDRPVASLLRSLPIPAVNGPSGHLSPFPAAGGCMHLFQVDRGLEGRFVEALEQTPRTIVVWKPDDPALIEALEFPAIEAVVRRLYRPAERFGHIEVWMRADECPDGRVAGPSGAAGPGP